METWCWDCSLDRFSKWHQPDTELSQEKKIKKQQKLGSPRSLVHISHLRYML